MTDDGGKTNDGDGDGSSAAGRGEKRPAASSDGGGGDAAAAAASSSGSMVPVPVPIVPDGYEMIEEGSAKMIFKKSKTKKTNGGGGGGGDDGQQEVFYNPVQVQNRDLSVLMISMYAERRARRTLRKKLLKDLKRDLISSGKKKQHELQTLDLTDEQWTEATKHVESWGDVVEENASTDGLRILDALAATGLRSVRYAKEIRGVKEVIVNDLDHAAVEQARENVRFNDVSPEKIKVQRGDATMVMYANRGGGRSGSSGPPTEEDRDVGGERFDVIDLDPYGTAAPFLDGAVQSIVDGGMLCVTCTDMAVLSGGHPETCYGRYGSMPMPKGRYLHELALRILLHTISTCANRYGRVIRPILSVGMHFYVRVFVEVHDSRAEVKKSSLNVGHVYQSTQCPTFYTVPSGSYNGRVYQPTRGPPVPRCQETGAPFKMAGPCWLAPIHDFEVVDEAVRRLEDDESVSHPLATKTPLHGLLTAVGEELSDVPLYYLLPDLCHTLSCTMPPMTSFRAALHNAGYRCSAQHKEPQAVKTDAPPGVVWDVMRAWVKDHPIHEKRKRKKKNGNDDKNVSTGEKILSKEPQIAVDFTVPKGFGSRKKAQRYPMNPEANWGPKARATGKKRKAMEHKVDSAPAANEDEKA